MHEIKRNWQSYDKKFWFIIRPQNDGPAERATTFILIADSYLSQTKDASYVTGTLTPGK